jgi:hypothetical protein
MPVPVPSYCSHQVDLSLTPAASSSKEQLHEHAAALVEAECQRLQSGLAVLAGKLPADTTALADALPAGAASSSGLLTGQVQLLLPPVMTPSPAQQAELSTQCQQQLVVGRCSLRGTVTGVVVAHSRQPVAAAAQDLKADLQASLRTRLELLLDDAEQQQQQQQEQQRGQQQAQAQQAAGHPWLSPAGSKRHVAALPRRVLMPWLGQLRLCDYLLPGEEADACVERAQGMMALSLQQDQVRAAVLAWLWWAVPCSGGLAMSGSNAAAGVAVGVTWCKAAARACTPIPPCCVLMLGSWCVQVEEVEGAAAQASSAAYWDPLAVEASGVQPRSAAPAGGACSSSMLAGAGAAAAALLAVMGYLTLGS